MGKLVVTEFVSVDGVFEDPGGSEDYEHGGWTFEYDRGDDGNKFKVDELMEAEVQLLGRVTYEGFAEAWLWTSNAVSWGGTAKPPSMPACIRGIRVPSRNCSQLCFESWIATITQPSADGPAT